MPSPTPQSRPPADGATRRTIAKGTAWALPVVSLAAASPRVAASPSCTGCSACAFGGGTGSLSTYWTSGNGTTATWTKCGVTVTFSVSMVTGTAIGTNGTISTTATGLAGGSGIGDSATMNGLVLNMSGSSSVTPLERINITFSKPVCNFQMYMRDVSWYSNASGAHDRDAVYWGTTPSSVASYLGSGAPNGAITGTGATGNAVRRNICCGTIPSGNGYYYDLQANWTGLMSSLTMFYTNYDGATTRQMYMQIRDLSYCVPV